MDGYRFDGSREAAPTVGSPREQVAATPWADLAPVLQHPDARARLLRDPTPLPSPEERQGFYGERHLDYWLSGLRDWLALRPLLRPARGRIAGAPRFLDLGGSSGRIARHAAMEEALEVWLADVDGRAIYWIDRHFARPIRAFRNRPEPHLPVPDGFFDLVAAFSVFPQIDGDERHWLLELLRVTRPGGRLVVSVSDEHAWARLGNPDWAWLRDAFAGSNGAAAERFTALVEAPLPAERFVWRTAGTGKDCVHVFAHSAHIRRHWGRFAEIEDYRVGGHSHQSVVVLRKPG